MKRILVPIDFSPVTDHIVETAESLAGALDGEISLLHVLPHESGFRDWDITLAYLKEDDGPKWRRRLASVAETVTEDGFDSRSVFKRGDPIDVIIEEIDRLNIDMVIMGSHGRGALYDLLVGSVSEGVIRRSTVPVLIVPSDVVGRLSADSTTHTTTN